MKEVSYAHQGYLHIKYYYINNIFEISNILWYYYNLK